MSDSVKVESSRFCFSDIERRIQALDDRMNNIQNTLRETMSRLNESPSPQGDLEA